ncbi:hypothetical protein [Actinokineospora bangkokensis]|uniref:Uncharacterized protein n=1 Tax=Actinokineospora bangkokensis TaxID=1193682 RepID=A0A1Q9LER4_9PSEU|nr:hypothetical protein [Actinokineospora bangkokensis]OLR90504.1 hypothetical protein BJP25_28130 [Actinokineospora bangkokensis]
MSTPGTPPGPPPGRSDVGGYHGDEEAFAAYTAAVRPLAERLHSTADQHGGADFGEHAFSKIGSEVGLAGALRAAGLRQHRGVRELANSLDGTAQAVRNTWTNIVGTEQDAGQALRRAAGEV